MTLHMFGQPVEAPADVAAQFPDVNINNAQDGVREGATGIILDGTEAPTIIQLPEGAEPKIFGTFEEFWNALTSGDPTYTLPQE